VSAGNAGQLAIDLFISNFECRYVGRVDAFDYVVPIMGSNPYAADATVPLASPFDGNTQCVRAMRICMHAQYVWRFVSSNV